MKTAVIALKNASYIPQIEADYFGADRGALFLMQHHYPITLAIGDFDSVTESEKQQLDRYAKKVIVLNTHKDDSDSEHTIEEVKKRGYKKIYVASTMDGRADHGLVNIRLAYKHPEVILIDTQNKIQAYSKGVYTVAKEDYTYVSVFTLEEALVTMENVVYPLESTVLHPLDTYTVSNEIIGDSMRLEVKFGKVIVFQTKDI